jgi:hemerythrin-like domain-containing protein
MSANGMRPALLDRLGSDHARIAQVVREFMELSDAVEPTPNWLRLGELIEFLDYYADQVHHPLEDRLFDRLVDKGLTPTERHLVFKNLGQHQEIRAMTERLASQISVAIEGGAISRDDFVETAAEYVNLQRRHMRFEESHLFPLLEAELENKDWNVLMGIADEADSSQEKHE